MHIKCKQNEGIVMSNFAETRLFPYLRNTSGGGSPTLVRGFMPAGCRTNGAINALLPAPFGDINFTPYVQIKIILSTIRKPTMTSE